MKKLICLSLVIIFSFQAMAQNDYPGRGIIYRVFNGDGLFRPGVEGKSDGGNGANVIKLNIFTAGGGNITLGYERALTKHLSLGIYGRASISNFVDLGPDGNLFESFINDEIKFYSDQLGEDIPDYSLGIGTPQLVNWAITPEIRYYFKDAPKGFYIGPYFRYRSSTFEQTLDFIENDNRNFFTLKGNNSSAIVGLMLGVQIFASKRWGVDFVLGGLQYGSTVGNISWESDGLQLTNQIQTDIRNGVDDFNDIFPIDLGLDLTQIDAENIKLEHRALMPGIRLPSLLLSFRF